MSKPAVTSLLANNLQRLRPADASRPSSRPARGLAILTCMDARLDLLDALGLSVGDAHVLRNAGGRATSDVMRSLAISTHVLGVREVGLVQHTDCRLERASNTDLELVTGLVGVDFLPFESVAESLRVDVAAVREAGVLPAGCRVWGAVYDVATGALTLVHRPRLVVVPSRPRPR
jgi:carbonic anhydrase